MAEFWEQMEKAARAQGWRIVKNRRHLVFFPVDPAQPQVVTSRTPSDWRTKRNLLAQLRRSGLVLEEKGR